MVRPNKVRFEWIEYDSSEAVQLFRSWDQLWKESPHATVFQSRFWIETWMDQFRFGKEIRMLVAYEGLALVGVWCFQKPRGPVTIWKPCAANVSDELGPLVNCNSSELAVSMIISLKEFTKGQILDIPRFPFFLESELGAPLFTEQIWKIPLKTDYSSYLASLSSSLRYDLNAISRHGSRYRIETSSPEAILRNLEILFKLHASRWNSKRLPGVFSYRRKELHRHFAKVSPQSLKLLLLFEDNIPIGAWYGLSHGNTLSYYQAGLLSKKDRSSLSTRAISPGSVLIGEAIRQAYEEGKSHFSFLRGEEPYKLRYRPAVSVPQFQYFIRPNGFLHEGVETYCRAKLGVESILLQRFQNPKLKRGLLLGRNG